MQCSRRHGCRGLWSGFSMSTRSARVNLDKQTCQKFLMRVRYCISLCISLIHLVESLDKSVGQLVEKSWDLLVRIVTILETTATSEVDHPCGSSIHLSDGCSGGSLHRFLSSPLVWMSMASEPFSSSSQLRSHLAIHGIMVFNTSFKI